MTDQALQPLLFLLALSVSLALWAVYLRFRLSEESRRAERWRVKCDFWEERCRTMVREGYRDPPEEKHESPDGPKGRIKITLHQFGKKPQIKEIEL